MRDDRLLRPVVALALTWALAGCARLPEFDVRLMSDERAAVASQRVDSIRLRDHWRAVARRHSGQVNDRLVAMRSPFAREMGEAALVIDSALQKPGDLAFLRQEVRVFEQRSMNLSDAISQLSAMDSGVQRLRTRLPPSALQEPQRLHEVLIEALRAGQWDALASGREQANAWQQAYSVVRACLDAVDLLSGEAQGTSLAPSLQAPLDTHRIAVTQAIRQGNWSGLVEVCRHAGLEFAPVSAHARRISSAQRWEQLLTPAERAELHRKLQPVWDLAAGRDPQNRRPAWDSIAQAWASAEVSAARALGARSMDHVKQSSCVRILSIDGGGVRGIVPALMLDALEQSEPVAGRPLAELFDTIVGTSAGGILALGLAAPLLEPGAEPAPGGATAARSRPQRLVELFEEDAATIFPLSWWKYFRLLVGPRYGAEGIDRVLERYFGDQFLSDVSTRVLLTTFALERRDGYIIDSAGDALLTMREAARATSAAPTFLRPVTVMLPRKSDGQRVSMENDPIDKVEAVNLVDGGVFANDPLPRALAWLRRDARGEAFVATAERDQPPRIGRDRRWLVLALGTGTPQAKPLASDPRGWGGLRWLFNIVDVLMAGQSVPMDPGGEPEVQIHRLQLEGLPEENATLDDASPANLAELKRRTRAYLGRPDVRHLLEQMKAELVRERPAGCEWKGPR